MGNAHFYNTEQLKKIPCRMHSTCEMEIFIAIAHASHAATSVSDVYRGKYGDHDERQSTHTDSGGNVFTPGTAVPPGEPVA